jgi:hypothetical protein
MPAFRINSPRIALPHNMMLWLLEGGIALVVGAYLTYQCYLPLARWLDRSFDIQSGAVIAGVFLTVAILPLVCVLLALLVLHMAGRMAPAVRVAVDMLLLTLALTALAIPALQSAINPAPDALPAEAATRAIPLDSGPLNYAPAPLKLERITLGAEIFNTGTHPLEVGVSFVRLNERGRLYCAGKPIVRGNSDRVRLAAGESVIFRSGNCQDGHVALTVWDTAGRRIYQASAISASRD